MGAAEESNRQEHSEQAKPRKRFSSTHTSLRGISLLNLVSDKGVFFPGQTEESPSSWDRYGTSSRTLYRSAFRSRKHNIEACT